MILASEEQIKYYTSKGVWGEKTLLDVFLEDVEKSPEKTAVTDPLNKEQLLGLPPERITYAGLQRAVDATAASLRSLGVEKDDIVIVQLPNCWELAMLYLAVGRAGGIISPAPMQWRTKEIGYVLDMTEAETFITVDEFRGFRHADMGRKLAEEHPSLKKVLNYEDLRAMAEAKIAPDLDRVSVESNDIFTICWTSGTEAEPKGCPLSHNNWLCQAALSEAGGIEPGDIILTAGPLVNMASVGTAYITSLYYGGTLVLHHPFNAELLLKQMIEEKINFTLLVPAVVNFILKSPASREIDLSSIRSISVGSAPPSLWAMEEFKKRWDIDISNTWGQNEGTGIKSGAQDVPDMSMRVNCLPRYGTPGVRWSAAITDHIHTKVVDPQGNELHGEASLGELLYKGPNVIPGYFKRPDLNKHAFDPEGYIHTGDLFELAGDRYLRFFDRAKDIIIRGGYNISAQEVENILLGHHKIQEIAAIAMPDENLGERTCVYAVPKPGETITLEELTGFMKKEGVAAYKFPERLEVLASLPRNPVGKLLKKELRKDLEQKSTKRNRKNKYGPEAEKASS